MKKLLALLAVLCVCFAVTSCGNDADEVKADVPLAKEGDNSPFKPAPVAGAGGGGEAAKPSGGGASTASTD